jgi:sugar phosphate isomerase/epimerase
MTLGPSSKISAFPKCFMDALCVTRTMSLVEWIDMASTLGVDGLELYPGFFTSLDREYLGSIRAALARHSFVMPMLCASPDFTKTTAVERQAEVARMREMIDLVAFFDAPAPRTCRVLSGQRRPELSEDDGVAMVVEAIGSLLPHAEKSGVILVLENHYKDNYWTYPEFAQHLPVFRRIVEAIDSPWFGVNFDPSNAILAGDDPLAVLETVKHRVVCMHASDRGLMPGHTLEELRGLEDSLGYASILHHGEIGTGLNDYPAIFRVLRAVGFDGWISIEDGMNGLSEIRRSVEFLRATLAEDEVAAPLPAADGAVT